MPKLNLQQQRFHRLTAIRETGRSPAGKCLWHCLCDCGNTTTVIASDLRSGNTRSCGCLGAEVRKASLTSHGLAGRAGKHPLYDTWNAMLQRCHNPKDAGWPRYGGRGIRVVQRWHNLVNFIADMGERPRGHSLERSNNNGPYSKANCVWALPKAQSNNRANNRWLTLKGERKTLAQWAEVTGLSWWTLHCRLKRGWSVHKTLTTPLKGTFK